MMSLFLLLFILCLAEIMLFGQHLKDLIYWTAQRSPDRKYLATSSTLGKIIIWNKDARMVRELEW